MSFGHFFTTTKKRIYLDYAAATPVRKEVFEKMRPYFSDDFGNPSAIHSEGQTTHDTVESARESVARTLGIRHDEVVFTASGTESNNLALYGLVEKCVAGGKSYDALSIISTKMEHPSVLKVLEDLATRGVHVSYVDVDADGRIDTKHLTTLLDESIVLVTFAYANSEIGAVQDVKRISRIVKKYNSEHSVNVKVHLDAAQAPLWLVCRLEALGVDMMSLDAGKCYGPKGVGMLAVRHDTHIQGVLLGGGQERGLRAGTENTPLIVGAAEALKLAQEDYESRAHRVAFLRDAFFKLLSERIEGVIVNGSQEHRLANNVNISIPPIDSEFAVVTLDSAGIAASTRSACSGKDSAGSSVVRAISGCEARARSTIRFSLGEETTKRDIEKTARILGEHIAKMRAFEKTLSR